MPSKLDDFKIWHRKNFGIHKKDIFEFVTQLILMNLQGPFTNYIMQFSLFFDHPSIYGRSGNSFLITYLNRNCVDTYVFANHSPISMALLTLFVNGHTGCIAKLISLLSTSFFESEYCRIFSTIYFEIKVRDQY